MFIKDIFVKDVGRNIQSVVKVSENIGKEIVEIDEYVITQEIFGYIEKFIDTYKNSFVMKNDAIGFWISGFFGSGKSHFLKILYYILKKINLDLLIKNNECLGLIKNELEFVAGISKDVIIFNIDSKNIKEESMLDVFVNEFNAMRGFSSRYGFICELEEQLSDENIFDDFKEEFLKISNVSWEEGRDKFYFYNEQLVKALSVCKNFGLDVAQEYFLNIEKNYKMNIDNFARKVNDYLNKNGEDHSIVFMVDEVSQFIADDVNKILNLQTIVEELSIKCLGRAFVIVTSHVDILDMVSNKKYDFSKIQSRFKNKFYLSSVNIGEVLCNRLLVKKDEFKSLIEEFYDEKKFFIKTKFGSELSITNNQNSINKDSFMRYYPFLPYQLELLREIIFYMMKNNVISRDISKGERSLINCFQKVLINFKDNDINCVVPFYMFYDAISDFIDYNHQYIFLILKDYTMLDEFDINILKVLFLIKYVPNLVGNIDTILSLIISDISLEQSMLNKVKNSLSKLINEGFVNRDGDKFYFLSKNERDINYKIIRSNVNSHDINDLLCREIFDEIIGITKFKYRGKNYFGINQLFDNMEYKVSKSNLIGIKILMTNYDENFNLDLIRVTSIIENNVIVYLDDDKNLIEEINLYLKLDKFLKYNKDFYKESFFEIINQKEIEHFNRLERVKVLILDGIKNSKIFVNGEMLCKNSSSINEIFRLALNELISCRFNKLFYVDKILDSPRDIVEALNNNKILSEILNCNSLFIQELEKFLIDSREMNISDVIFHFKQIPYGFNKNDVLFGILYLVKEGKLSCEYSLNKLEEFILSRSSLNKIIINFLDYGEKCKFNIYKKLFEKIFDKKYFVNTFDELKISSCDDFNEILHRIKLVKNISKNNGVYLNTQFINKFESFTFQVKDGNLHDIDEDYILRKFDKFELVYNFYTSVQLEIFKKGVAVVEIFDKDKNFIVDKIDVCECAFKIKNILNSESLYSSIAELRGYIDDFYQVHNLYLQQTIKSIGKFLDSEISKFIDESLLIDLKEKLKKCTSLFDSYGVKMESIFLKDRGTINE
ncbi:BREX system P-loop protein BrxC [Candidatus Arthromitus sp. SFB-rat-Yit]|uniref:BREX system P-loop protein BrxC n=1 Tax=Candidatus Arthromitus sp. SFB-rat-Yit TaxID=1041504 RepID=UPI000227A393|nr:BREX system P-loop protein BrxC [Candidatus Arthromitus sp. SFB-rat-Yit]BAK81488.1 hypothetical protein RATSFB_0926 [Candidatus Arthromitus sp. SFB-rat-Yit]